MTFLPEQIRTAAAGITAMSLEDAAWSVGLAAAAFVFGRFVAWVLLRSTKRWARKTDKLADDLVARHMPSPLRLLLPSVAVALVLPWLPLRSRPFEHVVLLAIVVSSGWLAFRALLVGEGWVAQRYDFKKDNTVRTRARYTQLRAFRNIGSFVIVLVTVGFALMTFDTVRNIGTGLLASAGVAGIVIGFAAQKTLATLLAGVQIAVAQPIRVGDTVVVEGESGTVEEISLTYVVLRIWDYRRLVLPVQYFIDKPFQNWTRGDTRLLGTVQLKLDYTVPVDALRAEAKRILDASKLWDKLSSGFDVTDAGERTMTVQALVSAKNADDLGSLKNEMREKLIAFVLKNYPDALPKLRTEGADRKAA
ncbi:MAG TPA: mechanosensitive ion channel domain-containing protein [Polyangiaceae bacterium]|jgi:small-conductance mechanosensitive channel